MISKVLFDLFTNLDQFPSLHTVERKYNDMKEEIKNPGKLQLSILCKNNGNIFCRCKNNTVNTNSTVTVTKQNRLMLVLNCFFLM